MAVHYMKLLNIYWQSTNWEITSSASYYLVSAQYYWTSRVAGDTHMLPAAHAIPIVVKYIDRYPIICHTNIIFTIKLHAALQ